VSVRVLIRGLEANKGIGGYLMVRLGLATGRGSRMTASARQGQDWNWKTKAELTAEWNALVKACTGGPFGPYDAMARLIGQERATHVAKNAHIMSRRRVVSAVVEDDDREEGPSNKRRK
jgi:hypothetical protein